MLSSLGGVAAAMTRAGRSERESLAAAPPTWQAPGDTPAAVRDKGSQPEPANQDRGVRSEPHGPPGPDPDSAELRPHQAAFDQALALEGEAQTRQAARPAGEHAIIADAGRPIVAVVPPIDAPLDAAIGGPRLDGGISQVAEDERGPEVRQAAAAGSAAVARLTAEHAGRQAEIDGRSARELEMLETESRSRRDAERDAAIEHVAGIRRAWSDQRNAVLAETAAQGDQTRVTALEGIAKHRTEAEHAAAASRDQGKREAQKTQGPSAGLFGAIGSVSQSVLDRVGQAARAVLQVAEQLAQRALEKGRQLVRATVQTAEQAFHAAIGRGRSLLAAARQGFSRAIRERVDLARSSVNGLMAGLRTSARRILDAAALARAASVHLLQVGWHAALDGVRATVQGALDFARNAIQALGAFAVIVRDVAADPGRWLSNLTAGAQDGLRNHLWPDLQEAIREWFDDKAQSILGLGAAVWSVLQRGGISLAEIGHALWEAVKASIPPTLISILIEKVVSLLVPAAAAALLIVQAIQAAWSSLSRILQASDAFMRFLRAVRSGQPGPLFGKALAAGAVALIDFVSNFLMQRLGDPIKKAAGRLRARARQMVGRLGSKFAAVAKASLPKALLDIGRRAHKAPIRSMGLLVHPIDNAALAQQVAGELLEKARTEAPSIRKSLTKIARQHGGQMKGLENEFKKEASLTEKIAQRLAAGEPVDDVKSSIKDSLRYTMTFDPDDYSGSTAAVLDRVKAEGFRQVDEPKNMWGLNRPYVGIHTTLETNTGQKFELQLHTGGEEGSWVAKEYLTHDYYKELTITTDKKRRAELLDLMTALNRHVKIPPGVEAIGKPVSPPAP